MDWKRTILTLLLSAGFLFINAQESAIYKDLNDAYKQGSYFYENALYGQARQSFLKVMNLTRESHQGTPPFILHEKAELYHALSSIQLDQPDGERLVLDFIHRSDPSAIANEAKYEMGNYYFKQHEFQKALDYYVLIEQRVLEEDELYQLRYKKSYAYFVRKKFDTARSGFKQIKNIQGEHYYAANYYYGVCAFFENDYDDALTSFIMVEHSNNYSKVIPYYICQIHFAKGEYKELIEYGVPALERKSLKYIREINQLIGQSYFELGDFDKALPYLEYYVDQTGKLTEKEIYQLAYTQYRSKKYQEAITNFEQLRNVDSELGQNALYNLAGSYFQTNYKTTARNAFFGAGNMDYNQSIREESRFNYAKLSYELGYDREAINTLTEIKSTSKYYSEAQDLMGEIFFNTGDYARSLEIIEAIQNKNPKMDAAYQKVAYYRGVQLYFEEKNQKAKELFDIAAGKTYNKKIKALASYWIAEIEYSEEKYDRSISSFKTFQTSAKSVADLPDEASIPTSNYSLGYNYWKKKDFNSAKDYFIKAVNGIQSDPSITDNYVKNQILSDATLRTADCYFKANNYSEAVKYYSDVVASSAEGFDYALFQKAIILGLQKKSIDKILALESIFQTYPNSFYADDAMFELGNTYLSLSRFDVAATTYEGLLNKYKTSEYINPSLLKLGLIYVNLGQNAKGLEYFKRVFANNPEPQIAKDALNGIEEIYIAMDDTDGYFAFLESIPGYSVTNATKDSIKFKAAEAHYVNGDFERAAQSFSDYIKKFSRGNYIQIAYFRRAESFFAMKEYEKSLSDYSFLLNNPPNKYLEVAAKKAALISYNITQNFAKAYTYYTAYLENASSDVSRYEAQLGALRSAFRSNNPAAVYDLAPMVMNNSKASKPEKAAANYYLAKTALKDKRLDEARIAFNKVIDLTDDERAAEARYQIAYIYYLERDLEVAKQLALTTNSEVQGYEYWLAKSVLLLADIFVEEGDFFNARASLESILENYTGDDEILAEARTKLNKIQNQESKNTRIAPIPDPEDDLQLDAPIDQN